MSIDCVKLKEINGFLDASTAQEPGCQKANPEILTQLFLYINTLTEENVIERLKLSQRHRLLKLEQKCRDYIKIKCGNKIKLENCRVDNELKNLITSLIVRSLIENLDDGLDLWAFYSGHNVLNLSVLAKTVTTYYDDSLFYHIQKLLKLADFAENLPSLRQIIVKISKERPCLYKDFLMGNDNFKRFTEKFPPEAPENQAIYPIFLQCDTKGNMRITTIPNKSFISPDTFLFCFNSKILVRRMRVTLFGLPAVDEGGISRLFLSQVFEGLVLNQSRFEKQSDGRFLPVLKNPKDSLCVKTLNQLGRVLAYLLQSNCTYPIGEIFSKGMFEALINVKKSSLEVCKTLVDKDTAEVYQKIKEILSIPDNAVLSDEKKESVAQNILYFKQLSLLDLDMKEFNFPKIKAAYQAMFTELFESKVSALREIAFGMADCFPLKIKREDGEIEIQTLDHLGLFTAEELAYRIQGALSKDTVKRLTAVIGVEESQRNNLKEWFFEWVERQPDDMDTIKKFLQAITGAPAITNTLTFKLLEIGPWTIHTCFNSVDLPTAIDKDSFFKQLDYWGTGQMAKEFSSN